jgi:hypothetical protein
MADQSHREEMSAAIRAQRERHAVPKTIAPDHVQPVSAPVPSSGREPERPKRFSDRLRRK